MIKKLKFGFSVYGFVFLLLLMLPNIVWFIVQPSNDVLSQNSSQHFVLDIIENIFRILTMALLVVIVNKGNTKNSRVLFILADLCLIGYYILWICYYMETISPPLLIGMAVFPSAYLILVALWQKNYIAAVTGSVFGLIHIVITCINFK